VTARGKSLSAKPAPTLAAGVVALRETPSGWRVLLLRSYNFWDFPKGLVEPGEDPLIAARREAREEAGLDDLEFRWGKDYIETEPYSRNKIARFYLAVTGSSDIKLPVSPELGVPEHHEYRWLTWEAAEGLLVARLKRVLHWARSVVEASQSG
jgi:bis(5'-nucleosidyl)-tetraphosphatase